jgi:imidazoleglycerol-phosphate dehydratase
MAVVDISSRPHATIDLALKRDMIGTISSEMLKHVLESFGILVNQLLTNI